MFDIQTKIELQQGNPDTFKEVFRLLYPRLKGYCKLFISNESEVEDIIQEAFIAFWENHEKIDAGKSIENFIFKITKNRCLNFLQKKKLDKSNLDIEQIGINQLQYLYQLDLAEKENKSLEEELIDSFKTAIEELPAKMKIVFTQCKIEGKKQKDVAAELGISIKMVEKHINGAKQQIRKKLLLQFPALSVLICLLIG